MSSWLSGVYSLGPKFGFEMWLTFFAVGSNFTPSKCPFSLVKIKALPVVALSTRSLQPALSPFLGAFNRFKCVTLTERFRPNDQIERRAAPGHNESVCTILQ